MPEPIKPNAPELPSEEVRHRVDVSSLDHDEVIAEFTASDCFPPSRVLRGISVSTGRLQRVNLAESGFDGGHFTDLDLEDCDLANVRCRRANLTRVRFRGGRLTGLALLDSALYDIVFEGCRADLTSFADSVLVRVGFRDCLLSGAILMDARCESVTFEDCRMTEADFRGVKLENCQIRRCDLAGAEGVASLRGVAMEWADIVDMAPVWANALGIEVIDNE